MGSGEHALSGLDGPPECPLGGPGTGRQHPFQWTQQVGWEGRGPEGGDLKAASCQGAVGLHFPFVRVRGGKGREDVEETVKLLQNLRSGRDVIRSPWGGPLMSPGSLRVKASVHQGVSSLHSVAWAHLVGGHAGTRALQHISSHLKQLSHKQSSPCLDLQPLVP